MSEKTKLLDVQDIIAKHSEKLLEEIQKIDPELIVNLSVEKGPAAAGHFSDWHDRFKDGGRFTDGFGKAGGKSVLK